MTAADVSLRTTGAPGDSVVEPLGVREIIEAGLFVGPVGFDLRPAASVAALRDLERPPAARTLVLVPPGRGVVAPPMTGDGADLAFALSVPPSAHAGGLAHLGQTVDDALAAWGLERFDVLVLDGLDPFDHPASVADRILAVLAAGSVGALGLLGHSDAQVRALMAHLPRELRVALLGVSIPDVTIGSLQHGGLDLALELGAVPLVEFRPDLCLPGRRSADPESVAVLLHHPSRPLLTVRHDDLAGRALASESLLRGLDRGTIHELLAADGVPTPTDPGSTRVQSP